MPSELDNIPSELAWDSSPPGECGPDGAEQACGRWVDVEGEYAPQTRPRKGSGLDETKGRIERREEMEGKSLRLVGGDR